MGTDRPPESLTELCSRCQEELTSTLGGSRVFGWRRDGWMHLKTCVRRATKVVIRATFELAACWSGCHVIAGAPGFRRAMLFGDFLALIGVFAAAVAVPGLMSYTLSVSV